MQGRRVYRHAKERMVEASREVLDLSGWRVGDIDRFATHQVNARISEVVAEELGVPRERVLSNIEHVGNTSAASLPLLLADAASAGQLRPHDRLLLVRMDLTFSNIIPPNEHCAGRFRMRRNLSERIQSRYVCTDNAVMSGQVSVAAPHASPAPNAALALALEKDLGVEISEDEVADLERLDKITALIERRLQVT